MNNWGSQRIPFIFVIDFEMEKIIIERLDSLNFGLSFQIGKYQFQSFMPKDSELHYEYFPISLNDYKSRFERVKNELAYGNSFLLNLTAATEFQTDNKLSDFYQSAQAKYKLLLDDEFVCFSPETFVQIKDNQIFSYPMKGTSIVKVDPNGTMLLNDLKENAEHATIVDLIRNDLSRVSKNVSLNKFKYLNLIETDTQHLYQMSSEIVGDLREDFNQEIGTLLFKLLPAGSISGSPKLKTCEIIKEVEFESRSYYTGIVGLFDGKNLDSGVMIRCIEQNGSLMRYRSGGGITFMSKLEDEYQELINKIYVPVSRDYQGSKQKSLQYSLSQH